MSKRPIKVAAREGGPPPPFRWSVYILDVAHKEAVAICTEAQYQHLALQVREMAREHDPTHALTLDVKPIEDFHELRERGGIMKNLNVRVFFGIDKVERAIVILGTIQKQNDGPTPQGDKVRMRRRWRKYRNGEFGRVEG